MKNLLLRLGLFCAILTPLTASAQFQSGYGNWSFNNPMSATLNKITWDSMSSRLIYKTGLKRKGYTEAQLDKLSTDELKDLYLGGKLPKSGGGTITKPPVAQKLATRFKRTKTRVLMPVMVDSLVKDPDQRKALKQAFEQGMANYEKQAAAGGQSDDVGASIAFFTGVTFALRNEEPSEKAMDLLVNAIQVQLDTPQLRQVADIEKQKLYEFMVTMGTYLLLAKGSMTDSDPAQLKALQSAAEGVLIKFTGIDPAKVRLLETGLAPRKAGGQLR